MNPQTAISLKEGSLYRLEGLFSDIGRPEHEVFLWLLVGGSITSAEGPPTQAGEPLVSAEEPEVSVSGTPYQLKCITFRSSAYCVGQSVSYVGQDAL